MVTSYEKQKHPYGYYEATPMPSVETLNDFYQEKYYQSLESSAYQKDYSSEEILYKKNLSQEILYAVAQQVEESKPKRLLEIGFGEGFLLAEALGKDWEIQGLDVTDYAIRKFHPELAKYVHCSDAISGINSLAQQNQRFDAIILQNVLEHIREPESLLTLLRGILNEKGIVSITVPNDESILQRDLYAKKYVNREYWFIPPQHLSYFNTENCSTLANACNFEVVDLYTDFPVEFFLYQSSSNYITNPEQGKPSHFARIEIYNRISDQGVEKLHLLNQAQAACGIGRALTMVLSPK